MVIKVIFLDFDGTISDARKIAEDSLILTLEEFDYKVNKKKLKELLGTKMGKMLKMMYPNIKGIRKIRKRFYKHFTFAALNGGIKPCVSLKPLSEIKKDFPLVVISNSRGSFLKASIKTLGIKKLFTKIYGAEKFSSKDELLKKLFKKMKIKPTEAVYIGDRFSDVQFAKEAGCFSIAISNKCSWSSLARLKKEKPDFIIRDFSQLGKVLNKINSL